MRSLLDAWREVKYSVCEAGGAQVDIGIAESWQDERQLALEQLAALDAEDKEEEEGEKAEEEEVLQPVSCVFMTDDLLMGVTVWLDLRAVARLAQVNAAGNRAVLLSPSFVEFSALCGDISMMRLAFTSYELRHALARGTVPLQEKLSIAIGTRYRYTNRRRCTEAAAALAAPLEGHRIVVESLLTVDDRPHKYVTQLFVLSQMGFDEDATAKAVMEAGGNMEAAIDILLSE